MPDVLIIGGGVIGCATAVHLLRANRSLDVEIVEPDPTYSQAATTRSSGGVRQLFSGAENIRLSQYAIDVIETWSDFIGDAYTPLVGNELGWKPQGYLLVGPSAVASVMQANMLVQRSLGVEVEWLDAASLGSRYPVLDAANLVGLASPRDGWLDPNSLLQGLRRIAESEGATFSQNCVTQLIVANARVQTAVLENSRRVSATAFVIAAGCWSTPLAAQAGMPIPVEPMRRYEHYVELPRSLRSSFLNLPFIKDPVGLAVRPEGQGLSVGLVDFRQPGGFVPTPDPDYFERVVWPALVMLMPQLDQIRLHSTTVGFYDQNRLDGNAIVGNWPGHRDNVFLACGFSGHGLMHALGVGRALAELIVHGRYETIDLNQLGYERIAMQTPYPERGVR